MDTKKNSLYVGLRLQGAITGWVIFARSILMALATTLPFLLPTTNCAVLNVCTCLRVYESTCLRVFNNKDFRNLEYVLIMGTPNNLMYVLNRVNKIVEKVTKYTDKYQPKNRKPSVPSHTIEQNKLRVYLRDEDPVLAKKPDPHPWFILCLPQIVFQRENLFCQCLPGSPVSFRPRSAL